MHNTAWMPGHFHMTVAGPVFLAIIGMSLHIVSTITGKEIKFKNFYTMVPYIWMIGILIFSFGLMWGGLLGEPRRTNLGLTYTNPESSLFHPEWISTTKITLFGGIIMTVAFILYSVSIIATLAGKPVLEKIISFPVSEPLHEEKPIGILQNFKPWLVMMIIVILLAYVPALMDAMKFTGAGAPPYTPDNPTPILNSNE